MSSSQDVSLSFTSNECSVARIACPAASVEVVKRQRASALLAVSWITIALAQEAGDGDGADGDELAMPVLLGVAVLSSVAVLAFQRFSSKSRNSWRHPPREGSTKTMQVQLPHTARIFSVSAALVLSTTVVVAAANAAP
jgi:hypothetical protein